MTSQPVSRSRMDDSFRLGGLTLRSRWVVAPLTTYSSLPDGTISPDELPYLERRSAAGYGLVISAACYVHPSGHAFDGQWGCEHDGRIPSLASGAEAIHRGGALAALQIHHGGRQCPSRHVGTPWSASAIPAERPNAETPRAMTIAEIDEVIEAFGQAARRGLEAGFDAIEIHGANTYLLQQFVSRHSNRRDDEYGQDRLRFSREVVRSVRAQAGPAVVGYRLSPEEIETPGIRISDTEALISMLIDEGVDFIHLSLREAGMPSLVGDFDEPVLTRLSRLIAGRVPIIGVGKVQSVEDAERCLDLGADLVAVGRAAITEPDFPARLRAGMPPRLNYPREGGLETLTMPRGLHDKILNTPGWFEIDESSTSE